VVVILIGQGRFELGHARSPLNGRGSWPCVPPV
jgi:hypothetical protein